MQATLLAHTMLHHPRAWPKQETALGLLITLRKYLQAEWVRRHMSGTWSMAAAGTLPCARLVSPLTMNALLVSSTL